MATTKITNPDLFDLGSLNTALKLPSGTTAERPTSPSTGEWRYNTTNNLIEFYDGGDWRELQDEEIPPIPSEHFNVVIYTGTGGTQAITGVGFQPDWVWIKNRNDTNSHILQDSTRGSGETLFSNLQNPEDGTSGDLIASFDSDGFTVNENFNGSTTNESTNKSGNTYVAWCWKANGGTTTAGTGTGGVSSVTHQLNSKGGFCITKFTSGSSAGGTVTHGLDSAPDLIFMKTTSSTQAWWVWSSTFADGNQYLQLQSDAAQGSSSNVWNSTAPSASVVTLGAWNSQSFDYIMYAFKSKAGYSSFGSYTGNASSNGPIINTGFEPAYLMVKGRSNSGSWIIFDNKRNTTNPRNTTLRADSSAAEITSSSIQVDFLSNGFQLTGTDTDYNGSGRTYIYIAFASDPSAAPVLADSFDVGIYTGDGTSNRVINTVGFRPDFYWLKTRDASGCTYNNWFDTLRGGNKTIYSNATDAEVTNQGCGYIQSFDDNGVTYTGDASGINNNNEDFVYWAWKANLIPTINTDGSNTNVIVSANQAAGFSVIKWTGDGVNNATVGHGLSSTPELLIMKTLSVIDNWRATSTYLDNANGYLFFNQTGAETTTLSGDGSITRDGLGATTFTCTPGSSTSNNTNKLNDQYIAYAFHSVAGFSSIGTYTGSGSGNSQSINTGFAASYVMIKDYNVGGSWWIQDTERGGSKSLKANTADTESTTNYVTFTSTGFDVTGGLNDNASGSKFIYMAFKQNLTQYAIPSGQMGYLVVAGGAGGGYAQYGNGGGGGAGGLRTTYGTTSGGGASAETNLTLAAGTYTITVGSGGGSSAAGNASTITGTASVSTVGGGAPGYRNGPRVEALSGGSGGGGFADGVSPDTIRPGGAGTTGEGFAGADSVNATNIIYAGGGGGAAGAAVGQNGGDALAVSITANYVFYAGGGGTAGKANNSESYSNPTGTVTGGAGTSQGNNSNGQAAQANTGSGGGASHSSSGSSNNGGSGGSGIIVLRMNTSDYSGTTTGSPTVTTQGSETILTFTGSGTYVHS